MKKVLLASTAAIAFGLFSQVATAAEATVSVGGFANFQAGFFDGDQANETGRDFRNETEVHVKADFKADNGLEYGAQIEIESVSGNATSSLRYDEANLYIQGTWGRVEAGDQDGVVYQMSVYAPTVGYGQLDGDASYFLANAQDNTTYPFFIDLQDNTKVSYFSPRIAGFQLGASYTPEAGSQGDHVVQAERDNASSDVLEAVLNYSGEFGGVTVEGSASVLSADASGLTTDGANYDYTSWQAGLRLGYAGFQLGGGYADFDKAAAAGGADSAWNVGVAYSAGAIGVAAQYASVDHTGGDINSVGAGATYTVAPGLSVNADYIFVDNKLLDTEGNLVIIGTKLAF